MKIYWYKGSKNIIGSRVKASRLSSKPAVSQSDLSARLEVLGFHIDRVSISKIESGDRFVADYEGVALAEALNVSLEWLLTGKD